MQPTTDDRQHIAPTETIYQRQVYSMWYECEGDPHETVARLADVADVTGRNAPTVAEVRRWSSRFGWMERMRSQNARIAQSMDRSDLRKRREILELHEKAGRLLVERAIEHLESDSIVKTSDAIAAIKVGTEVQRKAAGIPEWAVDFAEMDDAALQVEYERLMQQMTAITVTAEEIESPDDAKNRNADQPGASGGPAPGNGAEGPEVPRLALPAGPDGAAGLPAPDQPA